MTPVSPLNARPATTPATSSRPAESPEAAARQFESVLVRQFVEVMTRDLFKAGEEGGMLTGQADLQRDTLTDVLTEHLVDTGTFGVADLMMRQWARTGRLPSETPPAVTPPVDFAPPPSEAPRAFDSPLDPS